QKHFLWKHQYPKLWIIYKNISISMTFKFNNKKLKGQSNGDIKYHCHNIIYYIYFSSIVRIVTCAFRSKKKTFICRIESDGHNYDNIFYWHRVITNNTRLLSSIIYYLYIDKQYEVIIRKC